MKLCPGCFREIFQWEEVCESCKEEENFGAPTAEELADDFEFFIKQVIERQIE